MITYETVTRPSRATFFFDPICPWTWITSRWLVEVAEARNITVDWRSVSLSILNGGIERMPEQYRERGRFSRQVQRVVEAMRDTGDHDLTGRFYTEIGTRLYVYREEPGADLLLVAAAASGGAQFLESAHDPSWDSTIARSTEEAMQLAGPDVGSPVLALPGHARGIYGPIVSPAPTGEDALRLWDTLVTLFGVPGFYELKRGRTGAPVIRPAATRASTSNG